MLRLWDLEMSRACKVRPRQLPIEAASSGALAWIWEFYIEGWIPYRLLNHDDISGVQMLAKI